MNQLTRIVGVSIDEDLEGEYRSGKLIITIDYTYSEKLSVYNRKKLPADFRELLRKIDAVLSEY